MKYLLKTIATKIIFHSVHLSTFNYGVSNTIFKDNIIAVIYEVRLFYLAIIKAKIVILSRVYYYEVCNFILLTTTKYWLNTVQWSSYIQQTKIESLTLK